jgi:hypothetical protein
LVEQIYIQFGVFRFNQHSIMVLKACQQHGAYQSGVEQLDIPRLSFKQPSQSNESCAGSDHLHSAKKVHKHFLNLAVYLSQYICYCMLGLAV